MRYAAFVLAFLLGALTTLAVTGHAGAPPSPATTARAAVVHAHALEERLSPSGAARLRVLGHGDRAFVALIEMQGGAAIPEHRDVSEEFVYVLEGHGTMTLDGTAFPVHPGTSVYMPSNVRVSFVNGPAPMRALQVFADPTSAAKYEAWPLVSRAPASP